MQVWDAQSGQKFRSYVSNYGEVNGLALVLTEYNAEAYIVAAFDNGTLGFWSWKDHAVMEPTLYRAHTKRVNAVAAFSILPLFAYPRTDMLSFASASDDQTVLVWSFDTLTPLFAYAGHGAPVKAVAASPVDNRVVSGDSTGLVHLWTAIPPGYQ